MSSDETVKVFGGDGWEDPSQSDLEKLADRSPSVTKAEDTQQGGTDKKSSDYFRPPEDPAQLLNLLEKSETHQACVSAKSKGVAGHGFSIEPHQSVNPDDVGDVPETLTDFWHSGKFQLGPGRIRASANEVLESAWNDLEAMGYLSIEVLASPTTGDPTGLAHIPSQKIRKRKGKPGYVELDDAGMAPTYYAPAGARYDEDDPTFIDANTGELADSASGVETVANELIVIRNYSALAPHYGLPDIVPGIKTVAGDLQAKEYNRVFFSNDTIPRFAVVVEGGELTDKSWKQLKKQFKKLRQNKNAHRGLLLETTNTIETQLGESTGANIRIEPLTVGVDEDAGFTTYRDNNEHYILQAHEVPPVVAGRTQDVNRSTAKSQRVNFAQEVIAPKQERFASRLYHVLHEQAFGIEKFTIEFDLYSGSNELRQSKILKNKASSVKSLGKVLTKDEIRTEVFDLPPSDEVDGETLNDENAPDIAPDQQPSGARPSDSQSDEQTEAMVEKASDWDEGDVVETPDGEVGVVTDIYTSDFSAYTEEGETIEVAEDETVYVVALESGLGYFTGDELNEGEIPSDEQADPDELGEDKMAELSKVNETFDLPDGWTRMTALSAWASMGGSWTGCYAEMTGEVSRPKAFCASFKTYILGTEYWR